MHPATGFGGTGIIYALVGIPLAVVAFVRWTIRGGSKRVLVVFMSIFLAVGLLASGGAWLATRPPAVAAAFKDAKVPNLPAIPVLEYHGISAKPESRKYAPYNVDVPAFTAQMAWLHAHGYHSIGMDQYVAWLYHKPVNLPSKPILITFDDGRADSQLALPTLHKYKFNATMFVVTAFADYGSEGSKSWESWKALISDGWDLQFHAGALGHLTWRNPYYTRVPLAASQRDINNGMTYFTRQTGIVSRTWAIPNGAWTPALAQWAATRFQVVWLEQSYPTSEFIAKQYRMRYRLEITVGDPVSYMTSHLNDLKFNRTG
jgi:peptidoglycan/xylan/chitin deacetylase (PgdA/CDA1 family)